MPTTVLVEPDVTGHRFQAVANVALRAQRDGDHVVLLTSSGAVTSDAFKVYLSDVPLEAVEVYDEMHPATAAMLEGVVARCRDDDVRTVVVMDADQTLKKWWLLAPRAFRRLPKRPQVVFFYTRYPARVPLDDRVQVKLRVTKALLTVVTMATGTLHRAAGLRRPRRPAQGLAGQAGPRPRDLRLTLPRPGRAARGAGPARRTGGWSASSA